jgi:hypothetical protein
VILLAAHEPVGWRLISVPDADAKKLLGQCPQATGSRRRWRRRTVHDGGRDGGVIRAFDACLAGKRRQEGWRID